MKRNGTTPLSGSTNSETARGPSSHRARTVSAYSLNGGMVKLEMLVEGLPEHETDHGPVDYAAIARGAGIEAIRIERPSRSPG
jgi:hypothetical protein